MRLMSYSMGALAVLLLCLAAGNSALALREDCGDLVNPPAKPVTEVAKEDVGVQNDYDQVVEEDTRPGVTYLTFINGDTPKANACGLNPSNDPAEWMGWGGPLDGDNVTIGEGAGSRNEIVIGGIYFPRGIGTHAPGTLVYDLSGGSYVKFEAYVGMSDEKDPAECGAGGTADFKFTVDGKVAVKTDMLAGTANGENVPAFFVEFDVTNAKELMIEIGNGGDGNGCDHAVLGDAKLLTKQALSVDPQDKVATTWGGLKLVR